MKPEEWPRLLISAGILLLFAFAFVRNPRDMLLIGALISMATGVVQYWLGSSKGSQDNAERADKANAALATANAITPTDAPSGAHDDPVTVQQAKKP